MEYTNRRKAKEGYTYKRKIDDFIMGNELYLGLFIDGTEDTIDNYEEINCPEKYKGNEAYDNTLKAERYKKETEN